MTFMPSSLLKAASNNRLRIGVIGTGPWGRQYLEAALANKQLNISAVCETSQTARQKALRLFNAAGYTKPALYDDYRQLLSNPALDAVIIATPAEQHYPIAAAALQQGKHVACGPVMGRTLEEHRHIVQLSRQTGKQYFTLDEQSYRPDLLAMSAMVKDGQLGQLESLYAGVCTTCIPEQETGYPLYPGAWMHHLLGMSNGNRYTRLRVEKGIEEYVVPVKNPRSGKTYTSIRQGEITTICLHTAAGQQVRVQAEAGHSTGFRLQGSAGSWIDYTGSLYLQNNAQPQNCWESAAPYLHQYTVTTPGAISHALADFVNVIQNKSTYLPVYAAANSSMITLLAAESARLGGKILAVPDVTIIG
ncbi:Gfo/Idh/MocA family protein [Chitinophaga qingshengii]|uniref:Gfo/Idh/MocA family oxidoreductase n=1 Tax=Chitinophaga qingshengii TaxID=1569794 RepID=A0ABR7TTQ3_9BACT|nr:Gfo/Idh/MocA family oxidoreductase [Chitinophaga qingshengii]MBC9933040.1 Gfo/Idh/MocA family oxidoreductase [Chitinophaga qingshengii]